MLPLLLLLLIDIYGTSGVPENCTGTVTFVKVAGCMPQPTNTVLLFSSNSALTLECGERCLSSQACPAFVVDYDRSSCFRVISGNATQCLAPQFPVSTNYFQKTCLQVPANCSSKLWALERVDGFELIASFRVIFANVSSGLSCAERCIMEKQFVCRSARYDSRNGECKLSPDDRRTQPDSYRATDNGIQYWENQCAPSAFSGQTCSLEEYPNFTLCCADKTVEALTQEECLAECEKENNFTCRGFTFISSSTFGQQTLCSLHSEDTSSLGPRAVQPLQGATYWEKVPCLNLLVQCSPDLMTVTLHTDNQFTGRLYVRGRSDQCSAPGRGSRDTALKIPLKSVQSRAMNECGVMMARSIGERNRTLISAVVIVQYNAIIQRRGDRAVKVGCLLEGTFAENITLGASLSFAGPDAFINGGTVVVNSSATPPTVSMQILDISAGDREAKEVKLGQNLELRINVDPPNSSYDIRAVHLVATSQDNFQSYLLIDERGCPSDERTFPPLQRVSRDSKSLVSRFQAFKFPRSSIVKFNVTVHFCPGTCPQVDCGPGVPSYGRRRKRALLTQNMFHELPLQFSLVVHANDLAPHVIQAPELNKSSIITAGFSPDAESAHQICMDWGTLLGAALAWVLLQFVILLACYIATHWRRNSSPPQDAHKLEDDFHDYDSNRHVHWADENI